MIFLFKHIMCMNVNERDLYQHLYESFNNLIALSMDSNEANLPTISMEPKLGEQLNIKDQPSMQIRYRASMVLAAVGDAIGYRGGSWQFCFEGKLIHQQLMEMTGGAGIKGLYVEKDGFPYSDDTVMHIATARGLLQSEPGQQLDAICTKVAKYYKACMKEMSGRAPGSTCIRSASVLHENGQNWKDIIFQKNGGGCGASMRAACIGLFYWNDMQRLIEISIETGRITHHNPLGYLGALVAALFTAFAIQKIHPYQWLSLLLTKYMPLAQDYVGKNRQAKENLQNDWKSFIEYWRDYALRRKMSEYKRSVPTFPQNYGVNEREQEYKQLSVNGWAGALGVDSVIIAYDVLLSTLVYCDAKRYKEQGANKWQEVCLRGMLHGGDSDSTGTIVGAWYGALYGFDEVYADNYEHSERKDYIEQLGKQIYKRAYKTKQDQKEQKVQ